MNLIIERHRQELAELCRRFHVARLEVFGSAAEGHFDEEKSDIDFLVDFEDVVGDSRFDNFFSLQRALSQLFGRSVDLVEPGGLRNPYFIRRVNESRRLVYAP